VVLGDVLCVQEAMLDPHCVSLVATTLEETLFKLVQVRGLVQPPLASSITTDTDRMLPVSLGDHRRRWPGTSMWQHHQDTTWSLARSDVWQLGQDSETCCLSPGLALVSLLLHDMRSWCAVNTSSLHFDMENHAATCSHTKYPCVHLCIFIHQPRTHSLAQPTNYEHLYWTAW
jgi:hypothetical protein